MKKFLQYTGIFAFALALVAFILMLSCPALVYTNGSLTMEVSSTLGIFGGKTAEIAGSIYVSFKGTWSAIIAFFLLIIAMVILLLGFLFPLFKVHALDKFAGVLNLVAVLALIVAGVFLFIEVPCFKGVNEDIGIDWKLGAGWIIAGILALAGGVLAILPTAADFVSKQAKRRK